MEELTYRTIRGEVSFVESFRRRLEMLRHVPLSKICAIVAQAPINTHIAGFIAANRNRCMIVTGNCDVWIAPLVNRLGVQVFSSMAHHDAVYLTGLRHVLDKGQVASSFRRAFIAVGDGQNDVPMFAQAR